MTTQAQAIQIATDALKWYLREAQAMSKHLEANRAGAVLASVTALNLDAGGRAEKAIAELAAIDAAAVQPTSDFLIQIRDDAYERAANVCDGVNNHDTPMTSRDCADAIRAFKGLPAQPPAPLPQGEQCPGMLRLPVDDGDEDETNLQEDMRLAYEFRANEEQPRLQGEQMFLAWEYYSDGWKDAIEKYGEKSPTLAQPAAISPAPSEQDKVDAERYRWLRDKSVGQWIHPIVVEQQKIGERMAYIGPLSWEALDVAIDAARASQGEANG